MVRLKKHIAQAVADELEDCNCLMLLLNMFTHKHIAEQKTNQNPTIQIPDIEDKHHKTYFLSKAEIKGAIKRFIGKFQFGIPHIKINNQPQLSSEQKLIINWDFEGINVHKESLKLSTYFKNALTTLKNYDIANRHSPDEYDLDMIPIWNEMKKFENFREMANPLRRQLSSLGYDPTQLNLLNIYDVAHLIKKHNKENPANHMKCQRTKFLKMFASCYGNEFIQKSRLLGCEEIAKDFIEYIGYMDTDRDVSPEKWEKFLYASSFFSVHHKNNRQFAYELDDYTKINDFSNLTLCYTYPYHTILHIPQVIDLNSNIIYFGVFRQEFQIIRNPEKERQYMKGVLPINPRERMQNG